MNIIIKVVSIVFLGILIYFIDENFVPKDLTNIQSRLYLGWICIGILYGGLVMYIIGVLLYKMWKKHVEKK
jgi:hypothetical protein